MPPSTPKALFNRTSPFSSQESPTETPPTEPPPPDPPPPDPPPVQVQTTLTGGISNRDASGHYGDHPNWKHKGCIRDIFANINGLPSFLENEKDPSLWIAINDLQADSIGLTELNLDWRQVPEQALLFNRVRYHAHQPCKHALAHNVRGPKLHKTQWGGCASLMLSKLLPRVIGQTKDPSGLGRWVTQLIEGKGSHKARFVTGYLPCRSAAGKDTVFSQHRAFFQSKAEGIKRSAKTKRRQRKQRQSQQQPPQQLPTQQQPDQQQGALPVPSGPPQLTATQLQRAAQWADRDPIQGWIEDFEKEILLWLQDDEKVIIKMDANSDVRSGALARMLRSHGFEEQITYRHGSFAAPPGTHMSNTKGIPIDGIWTNFGHGTMRCGYTAFGQGLPGDHRTCWIDLPLKEVLGYNPPDLHRVYPPDLTAKDPRVGKRYNKLLKKSLAQEGTFQKSQLLRNQVQQCLDSPEKPPFTLNQINDLHLSINTSRKKCGIEVAKRVRKKHTGAYPFSPKVRKLLATAMLWSKVIYYRTHRKCGTRQIRRLAKQQGLEDAFRVTLQEAHQRRKTIRLQLRATRKEGEQLRRNFVEKLCEARAKAKKSTKEGELKSFYVTERQRTSWRKIAVVNRKSRKGKVTKIWVTKTSQDPLGNPVRTRQECCTKASMEKAVMEENETRFTRCTWSAFFGSLLLSLIGVMFDGPGFWEILRGTWQAPDTPDLNPFAKDLLEEVRDNPCPAHFKTRPTRISQEEHSHYWKRRRAGTASERSELSFVHYIVGAHSPEVAEVDASLRSAAYELGFVPDAFSIMTDFQILKTEGVYDVEKMRTIKLMVALFNENNKKLGRDMMFHAEQAGMIAPEQHGSRKHRSSNHLGAEVELTFDILRQKRLAAVHVGLDASQCYDRMVHAPSALCMIQHGAPEPAVRSMFGVLQQAQNRVATAFGTSTNYYGGSKRTSTGLPPVQGVGQGNGAGPASFVALSSTGINLMRKKGYGTLLTACLSLIQLFLVCFMFVDDDQYMQAASSVDQPGEEVLPQAQEGLNYWVGYLQATGGAINPEKSYWYHLDYQWNGTGWVYRSSSDLPGVLTAPNPNGEIKPLLRKAPHEGAKQLGIFTTPNGSSAAEKEYLTSKAVKFADSLKKSGMLTRNEVWLNLTHTIAKTLEYPMLTTRLSLQDWKDINTIINQVALPKAGLVRTFPHAVLYGPTKYQGLGYMDRWHLQELTHLADLVAQVHLGTSCGLKYQMTLEQLRLETGHPGPFTDVPYAPMVSCTTSCWAQTLWSSCQKFGISIQDDFGSPPLLREGDCYLMPLFLKLYQGKDHHPLLRRLNQCRMFCKAVTLADLCTTQGDRISASVYEGTGPGSHLRGIEWPRQPKSLSPDHWQEWKTTLDKLFTQFATKNHLLKKPLGPWLVDVTTSCQWQYSPSTTTLYQRLPTDGFLQWNTQRSSRLGISAHDYHPSPMTVPLAPIDSVPASITRASSTAVRLDSVSLSSPPPSPPVALAPTTLAQAVDLLPEKQSWAVSELLSHDEGRGMAQAISQGQAMAVSDGSFDQGTSTSAFIITKRKRDGKMFCNLTGSNVVPGIQEEQDSYRAELGGVMGIVTSVALLCQLHQLDSGSLEIGLDGKSAKEAIFSDTPPAVDAKAYDLLRAVRGLMASLPIVFTGRHVKGHQDKHLPKSRLDKWAQLNIDMDRLAKRRLRKALKQPVPANIPLPYERLVVSFQGTKLSSINKAYLYQEIYGVETKRHWVEKTKQIPSHLVDQGVAWDALGKALSREPFGKRRWLCKHCAKQCGVGRCLLRRQYQTHNNCPRCDQPDETTTHVLQCQASSAIDEWQEAIAALELWMGKESTHTALTSAILTRLEAWQQAVPLQPIKGSRALKEAIEAQDQLGWENFLLGRLSPTLSQYQQVHYTNIGSQKTGKAWLARLIRQLWLVCWRMWEHRNFINNSTLTDEEKRERSHLLSQVHQEFAKGSSTLLKTDRYLLKKQTDVIKYSIVDLKDWLERVRLARASNSRVVERDSRSLQASQRFMTRWMRRAQSN